MASRINDIDMDYKASFQPKNIALNISKMIGYTVPMIVRHGTKNVDMAIFTIRANDLAMVRAFLKKNGLYASYDRIEGAVNMYNVCMRYYNIDITF